MTKTKTSDSTQSTRKWWQASKFREGRKAIKFIEANCVHTQAQWIGKPFRLLLWQKLFIFSLFALNAAGERAIRWVYLSVAKKNGKTELAAALGIYFLIGDDEPAPLVVCAAASDDQADLVFEAAKTMATMSPTLRDICECYDKEILVPSIPGAKLLRVAAAKGNLDGKNIYVVICDELHEWTEDKHVKTWNILTNGIIGRRRGMVIQITTAGHDEETVCGEQYNYAKRVNSGEIEDPTYLGVIYEAAETDDHRDEETWKKANPSYGVLVHAAQILDQLRRKPEAVFRRYFCNQWTAAEEIWVPAGEWDKCLEPELDLDPSLPTRVMVDVGVKHDSCAVGIAQKQGDRTVVRARIWENPHAKGTSDYDSYKFNIADAENYLRELYQTFPVPTAEIDDELLPGPEFNYDPHFFERSAQELAGDGLAMVEFPQNNARLCPASQALYELIVSGELAHDGNASLRRHVHNAVALETDRGWRIAKRKATKKIDGCVAIAGAAHRAQEPEPEEETVNLW